MSAISQYADAVNNTLIPLATEFNDARIALLAQYKAIDISAPDAQAQFDALTASRENIKSMQAAGNAAIAATKNLFDAAFAEDVLAANALVKSVTALLSATANFTSDIAAIQAAITAAIAEAAKSVEAAKSASPPPAADSTKAAAPPPASDPTKASSAVADGEKTGDSIAKSDTTTAPAASTDVSSKSTPITNAGSTTAGKAGTNATSSDPASIVGRRTYNPLGDFSSYTYKIGLYMMNPEEFNQYMEGDYTKISSFKLVAQSGGITTALDSARAPGFDLDLYIDDLEIGSFINSKETMSATNSIEFKFKIYEPYGFSFTNKLIKAQIAAQKGRAAAPGEKPPNQITALTENFLLTIKFYGYDKDGKLVSSTDYPQSDISKSDTQSVFERGFPIRIKDFKFKLENKVTIYNITAVQISEQAAKGTKLGTIPSNVTVAGETVQDVLVGASQDTTKKAIVGLVQALNAAEAENVKKESYTYPNVYKIEFEKGITLGEARMVPKEYYVKERAPFSSIQNPDGSNERTAWKNKLASIDKAVRTVELQAGTPIIQAIDQIITQSEYLKNMMTAIDKEIDQPIKETDSTLDKNPSPKILSWYGITTKVKINSPTKDPKRNDYAYEITYKVQEYQIPYIRAMYASATSSYYGPHKKYNYWYTGENTEILSYEQDFNLLYTVEGASSSEAKPSNTQSAAITSKSAQNADSSNTAKSGTNDVINSVKSFLYSPGDLLKFKLRVLGDPDYLMPSIGNSGKNGMEKWYGEGFTINPNSGQVFIEIYFEQAEDYDTGTGLLTPNGDIQFMNYPAELKSKIKGMVYMLTKVTSTFSKGKFEQTLSGIIPEFANAGDKAPTTPPAAPNDRTATSTPATAEPNQLAEEDNRLAGATEPVAKPSSLQADSNEATSQATSPTGGPSPSAPESPPQPPPYVAPNASTESKTEFSGASLVATDNFGRVFISATLPSGTQLPNIAGWGDSQWDSLIAHKSTKPEDIEILTNLKASYTSVVKTLGAETTAKVAANAAAKTEYDTMVANFGKNASGTSATASNNAVADDDRSKPA